MYCEESKRILLRQGRNKQCIPLSCHVMLSYLYVILFVGVKFLANRGAYFYDCKYRIYL